MLMILKKCRKKGLIGDCGGVATVEFALISLVVISLLPIMLDSAKLVNSALALNGSLRAGMQYALNNPNDTTGVANVVKNASGFPTDDVTVATTIACTCSGVAATCGVTCAGGGNPKQYNTITAGYTLTTIVPFPGRENNQFPISAVTYVRVQ